MKKLLHLEPNSSSSRRHSEPFIQSGNIKVFSLSLLVLLVFQVQNTYANSAFQVQNPVITGTVTDINLMPLPGVTVREKGTNNGTQTDFNGEYSLEVSSTDAILLFSYVGMETVERDIDDQVIDVVMEQSAESLDEVLVVGYGTQQKSDVTGAIGVVDGDELTKGPVANALQGLQGRVAGVKVSLNSGSPSSSPRVIIRGIGTINSSSDPLYVVDGVVMESIQYLNPNTIQSMEVLKDASSTAIYGARGANGVVLISTKRGARSEGTVVEYEGFVSVGVLPNKIDVLNSAEFLEVIEQGFENHPLYSDSPIPEFTTTDPDLFDSEGNPLYDTDWQEEATRTAISHNHQLSFRSRAENSSFGAFLNYADMEGIMLNSYQERISGSIAYDANPSDWFSVGLSLLVNSVEENDVQEGGGGQYPRRTMLEMPPIFPVKFPDGTWSNSGMISDPFGLEAMANPVHVLTTQDRLRERIKLFGNFFTEFHITENLDLRTQIGFDRNIFNEKNYSPTDLVNISSPNAFASLGNSNSLYWQQENYLTYDNDFGEHSINAVAGLSWQQRTSEYFNVSATGFSDDTFRYRRIQAASEPGAPSSGYDEWTMNSYFFRGSYNYQTKYLLTFTGRMDGSSRFGANSKYGFFPSVGVGYVLTKESFMEDNRTIDFLKLRASYGITGNTEIPTYQSLGTLSSGTTLINGARAPYSYINRLPNPDLEWEKTKQFDIGMDLEMFNRGLIVSLDYYYKLTEDLLLDRPVPSHTGFSSVRDNIGSVSNKGFEVLIQTYPIVTEDFSWESNLNFSYNKNEIVALGVNDEDIFPGPWWVSGSQTILRVGEPLSSFWGYERLGTWGTDEAAEAAAVGAIPGEAKRSEEKKIIGNGIPAWSGSFVNNFYYKNFDLSVDLQFVYDVDLLQQFHHSLEDRTGYSNSLDNVLYDSWRPDNQNTMVQQIRNGPYSGQNSEIDSRWIADGSFLRGNLITLGYNVDPVRLDLVGFESFRIYTSVQNAFVLTSEGFEGYDPESSSWGGSQWGQNITFFSYPRARTFTLGFNMIF